jgi:hypothetical protein
MTVEGMLRRWLYGIRRHFNDLPARAARSRALSHRSAGHYSGSPRPEFAMRIIRLVSWPALLCSGIRMHTAISLHALRHDARKPSGVQGFPSAVVRMIVLRLLAD